MVTRVVGYIRVSTLDQAKGTSKDDQKDSIIRYAGYKKLGKLAENDFFKDNHSGGNMERPHLQKLLTAVRSNQIATVLVSFLDRFSRNPADYYKMLEEFKKHGVKFVSIREGIETGTEIGEFFLSILVAMAGWERDRIRERMMGGKIRMCMQGYWPWTQVPLGYRKAPLRRPKVAGEKASRTLEVVDDEARIVKDIFNRYLKLQSIIAVANELKQSHIETRIKLNKEALWGILTNQTYLGKIYFRKDRLLCEKAHEPLVPQATFDRVQAILKKNYAKRLKTTGSPKFFLRGVLRCGYCGWVLRPAHSSGRKSSYYACSKKRTQGASACKLKYFPKEALESEVFSQFERYLKKLLSKEELQKIISRVLTDKPRKITQEIAQLDERLRRIDQKEDRLIDYEIESLSKKKVQDRMAQLSLEKKEIEMEKAELQIRLEKLNLRKLDIKAFIKKAKDVQSHWKKASDELRKRLIGTLIKSVTVYNEGNPKLEWYL